MRRHQMVIGQWKERGAFRAPRITFCCRKVGCISNEAEEQPKTRLERRLVQVFVGCILWAVRGEQSPCSQGVCVRARAHKSVKIADKCY